MLHNNDFKHYRVCSKALSHLQMHPFAPLKQDDKHARDFAKVTRDTKNLFNLIACGTGADFLERNGLAGSLKHFMVSEDWIKLDQIADLETGLLQF